MTQGRRTRRHASDPRRIPGRIIGPGGPDDEGGVIVDARNAVLLEEVIVSTVDPDRGGRGQKSVIAMQLSGRINQSQDRADVLYIFGADGAASILTELMALVGRASGVDQSQLLVDLFERLSRLREEGNLT